MQFDDYQQQARRTAIYGWAVVYPALGVAGEAGEVADKVKKLIRDEHWDGENLTDEQRDSLVLEMGDVLWYIANLSADIGVEMSDVAAANIEKLRAREERGVLKGSGDTR